MERVHYNVSSTGSPGAPLLVPPHEGTLADTPHPHAALSFASLVFCLLFVSSTRFTESILVSKYPRGYDAYRSRVAMFSPTLTPVWGALLCLTARKSDVEELVWGVGAREAAIKDGVKAE